MLTQDKVREVLKYDCDTGEFRWNKNRLGMAIFGRIAGCINGDGYIQIKVLRKAYLAHRLAWLYTYGEIPSMQIDHINGVKTDNRIVNLRLATESQNQQNKGIQKNNKSGLKGVSYNAKNNKWCAFCAINGKNKNLGSFDNKEDAHSAYVSYAKIAHGEFFKEI